MSKTHIRWDLILTSIVAVLVTTLITGYSSRDNLISGCERNGTFKNVEALAWEAQAKADQSISEDPFQSKTTREARSIAAERHYNTAKQIRNTIAIPKSNIISFVKGSNEIDRKRGCEEAFPAPIPFIE